MSGANRPGRRRSPIRWCGRSRPGTLPHGTFRRYFEQNILYLGDYARAIGLIIGKAPDLAAADVLSRFLRQIVGTEIPPTWPSWRGWAARRPGDGAAAGMLPATYAYTRHLLYTSAQGTCAEGLNRGPALPVELWGARRAADGLAARRSVYADWISLFGGAGLRRVVEETTGLLDRLGDPRDAVVMQRLSWIFDTSTRYEVQFWDMGLWRGAGRLMRAARIFEDLSLRVDELAVRRRGRARPWCGSRPPGVRDDLHILDGMIKPDPYPMTIGHEAAGVVEAAGEGTALSRATGWPSTTSSSAVVRAVPERPEQHLRPRTWPAWLQHRRW
jgi:thiaminase/transcriptional activator TenA